MRHTGLILAALCSLAGTGCESALEDLGPREKVLCGFAGAGAVAAVAGDPQMGAAIVQGGMQAYQQSGGYVATPTRSAATGDAPVDDTGPAETLPPTIEIPQARPSNTMRGHYEQQRDMHLAAARNFDAQGYPDKAAYQRKMAKWAQEQADALK